jgi:hypothetical protein
MPEPLEPTAVYPALPAASPPWPPPPGPPYAPPPTEIIVRIEYGPEIPYEPPAPRWQWRAVWAGLLTRGNVAAAAVALAPVWLGQSLGTLWGHALYLARTQQDISGAYVIAGTTTAVAAWRIVRQVRAGRRAPFLARVALAVCLFGTASMASAYDPVTLITGVHP